MTDKRVIRVVTIPHKLIYAWLVSFVCMVALAVVSVQYANYVDRKSNKRWCGVVVLLDDTYQRQPPTTPAGKELAREMSKLRKEFNC